MDSPEAKITVHNEAKSLRRLLMNDEIQKDSDLADLETAAAAVGVTVIVFFVVYWGAQIQSTYELLSMAYGW